MYGHPLFVHKTHYCKPIRFKINDVVKEVLDVKRTVVISESRI